MTIFLQVSQLPLTYVSASTSHLHCKTSQHKSQHSQPVQITILDVQQYNTGMSPNMATTFLNIIFMIPGLL
jgi:hypothetical protein